VQVISLLAHTQSQLEATLSRALAKNDKFFQQERENSMRRPYSAFSGLQSYMSIKSTNLDTLFPHVDGIDISSFHV
jgi:hypothetical protein